MSTFIVSLLMIIRFSGLLLFLHNLSIGCMLDPDLNPYTPNAGAMPLALTGRSELRADFRTLLRRLQRGYTDKAMILTGLRGVGKTVLLNDFARTAEDVKWRVIELEIPKRGADSEFRLQIAQGARRALLSMSHPERWRDRVRTAASVLRSFSIKVDPDGALTAGLGVEPSFGMGDVGDLSLDLTDLMVSLGQAAQEENTGVIFLIDEIQFLTSSQLEGLVMALHKTVQRSLPLTMAAAGLPQIAKITGDAKSYSERLFSFSEVGPLSVEAACEALVEPAAREGATFQQSALDECVRITEGYPYFIQEIGYTLWRNAHDTVFTERDVDLARVDYMARLDSSFFRVRLDRASALERAYMRAMAELGAHPHSASKVASLLGRTGNQAAPVRASLINKGLLYSTPDYGVAQFTVPQFDTYIKRVMPQLVVPPLRSRSGA
ncbi:MAG: ATP-binding protein [Cellulomonadaceae bacterium]|jgi:hypothetical protein|nr:ATP-binding protein [Cellulomonadaceae bacterium]